MKSFADIDSNPTFRKTLGMLPNSVWILVVVVGAGLSEGLGLAFFVPLLELLGGEEQKSQLTWLKKGFNLTGIPFNKYTILGAIVGLSLSAQVLILIRDRLLEKSRCDSMAHVREAVIKRLFQSNWGHLSKQASGELVNRLLNESSRCAYAFFFQVLIIGDVILIFILFSVGLILSWEMLVCIVFMAAIMAVIVKPFIKKSRRLGREEDIANRDYSFHIVDFMKAAKLIRVSAAEDKILARTHAYNLRLADVITATGFNVAHTRFITQSAPIVILAMIILFGTTVIQVPIALLLAFLLVMTRVAPRLIQLQQNYQNYSGFTPALQTLSGTMKEAEEKREERNPGGIEFQKLESAVTLHNVHFRHPGAAEASLDDVSLDIPRNKLTALVGPSGAGKTTVFDLLAGLATPTGGELCVDGRKLQEHDLQSWRKRIGYVTQDIIIFNDTLRNNLIFCSGETTNEEINEVLRLTHLEEVVGGMPDGLDTLLGEGGIRLSGGQRQRLALARALLAKPELLMLDEATSALDNESERIVQDAILQLAGRSTIFVVAHRLSTVRRADQIYVMEKGRICEKGQFDNLIEKNGKFKKLHDISFS